MPDNNNTATQDNTQAQGGNGATNNQTPNDGKSVIDYDKIQSMIDKGVQQKENAILKSYFEQQGMSEDEIKTAIGDYKSKKQTQAQAQAGELTKLQNANTELQSRLTNERPSSMVLGR